MRRFGRDRRSPAHFSVRLGSLRLFLKIEVERSQAAACSISLGIVGVTLLVAVSLQFDLEHRVWVIVYGLGVAVTFSVVFLAL
jgi:hypothetical protein